MICLVLLISLYISQKTKHTNKYRMKNLKNSKWFLVYTKSGEENKAKKNIENQGFQVFLPLVSALSKKSSELISIEPMFPSYLFIRVNIKKDNWTTIRSTKGVNYLVTFGKQIATVPSNVIEYIKSKTDKNDILSQNIFKTSFERGDGLIIKKGIFKDKEAIFLSNTSKERVKVLLGLLNKQVMAEMPATDIGKKEIIEAFKL